MLTPPRKGGGDGRKSHTWPPPSTYLKKCGNGCLSSPREPQIVNCKFATSSASFLPPCYVMYSRLRFGPVWVSFRVWTHIPASQPPSTLALFLPNFSLGSCFVKERKYVTKVFTTVEFPDIPRFSKPHFLRETVESRSLRGGVGCCCSKWKSRVSLLFFGRGKGERCLVWERRCNKDLLCVPPLHLHIHTHARKKRGKHIIL